MNTTVTRNELAEAFAAAEELHRTAVGISTVLDMRSRRPVADLGPVAVAAIVDDLAEIDAHLAALRSALAPYIGEVAAANGPTQPEETWGVEEANDRYYGR